MQDPITSMTFILTLNVTAPKWKEDKATGRPVLDFPRERRTELMNHIQKMLSPGLLKYVAKILVATFERDDGMRFTTHLKFQS
jgi:hypothetical protein